MFTVVLSQSVEQLWFLSLFLIEGKKNPRVKYDSMKEQQYVVSLEPQEFFCIQLQFRSTRFQYDVSLAGEMMFFLLLAKLLHVLSSGQFRIFYQEYQEVVLMFCIFC